MLHRRIRYPVMTVHVAFVTSSNAGSSGAISWCIGKSIFVEIDNIVRLFDLKFQHTPGNWVLIASHSQKSAILHRSIRPDLTAC